MKNRKAIWSLLLSAAFATTPVMAAPPAAGPVAPGDKKLAPGANQVVGNEITPAQQAAVEKGLAALAARQQRNGGFSGDMGGGTAHAGITALAGIAFMAAGNLPNRGKYGDNVQRTVDFIVANTQESGLISSDQTHGVMYGHGFATVFLGEVYGMTQDDAVKEKLQKAVRLIQKCQNQEGGWRYQPAPFDADISVTICQIMALRAARDAGIKVEKEVIDNAVKYVRRCQNPDGGFAYMAGQGSGSGFARSSAGVASLFYAGIYEGKDLDRGLNYLKQFTAGNNNPDGDGYYFYGNYYACQAMFLAGGDYWARYYPKIRESLCQRQQPNGTWSGEGGVDYGTAMALIILQMPNRYLPVFHGKGPGT